MDWLNAPGLQQKMVVRNDITDVLQPLMFRGLMDKLDFLALSADKDESKKPYTPKEFLTDVADYVFASTRKGRTLTEWEKKTQNDLLERFTLSMNAGIAGGMNLTAMSNTPEIPEVIKMKSRQTYGMLPVEVLGVYTNMEHADVQLDRSEIMGFDFRVRVNPKSVPSSVDHLYFDMLKNLQTLVKSKVDSGSTDTRQHYRLLLHKLEKVLKK